jgi:hypothetical protein
MTDLLSLADAVLARKQRGEAGVSLFHPLGNETAKQRAEPRPPSVETGDETPVKQRNGRAFEMSDDGEEAERAAIIEIDSGISREWAEGLARVLSSPPAGPCRRDLAGDDRTGGEVL